MAVSVLILLCLQLRVLLFKKSIFSLFTENPGCSGDFSRSHCILTGEFFTYYKLTALVALFTPYETFFLLAVLVAIKDFDEDGLIVC